MCLFAVDEKKIMFLLRKLYNHKSQIRADFAFDFPQSGSTSSCFKIPCFMNFERGASMPLPRDLAKPTLIRKLDNYQNSLTSYTKIWRKIKQKYLTDNQKNLVENQKQSQMIDPLDRSALADLTPWLCNWMWISYLWSPFYQIIKVLRDTFLLQNEIWAPFSLEYTYNSLKDSW